MPRRPGWKILTILGATSAREMVAAMTVEAAADREIFLAELDHVLCPALQPGDVMVMDIYISRCAPLTIQLVHIAGQATCAGERKLESLLG